MTGSALFVRHARGVELTPAGRALLDHAAKVIEQVNRMAHEMSDYVAGVRGHIHVDQHVRDRAVPARRSRRVPHRPSGHQGQPGERLSHEIVDALASGKADLGVFADNVPAPASNGGCTGATSSCCSCRARTGSPRATASLRGYARRRLRGASDGSSLLARMTDAAFAVERSLKLRIQVSNFDGVSRMIEAGPVSASCRATR